MTPHRHSEGGSFMIDRRFKGIGRVHMASGITQATTFRAFNDGLTQMAKDAAGREWIRAMQRREVAPIDVWGVYRDGRWREAPRPETASSLVEALEAWREDKRDEVAKATYVGRKHLITQVRAAARSGAAIDELPTVFREVKRRMKKAPVSFNQIRNYLRAFLRDTLGKRHELYQVVQFDVLPMAIPGHAKKKEQKRHPLTPAQVQLLASKFSRVAAGGGEQEGHGHSAIAMALTGMHPKEYYVDGFSVASTYVHVRGEKRAGRDRKVPRLFPSALWPHLTLTQPMISDPKTFGRAFRDAAAAAKLTCTPLDLRRSFANWMEAADIDRTRRRMYMGHGARDVTDLYETQELLQHIVADGEKLRAWIDRELGVAQRPRLVQEAR